MAGKKNDIDKSSKESNDAKVKLKDLHSYGKILSDVETNALGKITKHIEELKENVSSGDEIDEELENEYYILNDLLNFPEETHSLTKIDPNLPQCLKYGVRSGLTHMNMSKFSPLSRGYQGAAIAIAAYATTSLQKARCWNELIIDQILEDGDTYYCDSYKEVDTDDRRTLTVVDLKKDLIVQNSHHVYLRIDEPSYAGAFRSECPTEMHLMKALDLFFKRYDAGILTSPRLNVAIWRDARHFNIFDGQARKENCEPVSSGQAGSAKLMLVRDISGVAFIILEKSNVKNEPFVLFGVGIKCAYKIPATKDDPAEPEKTIGRPRRRPSGYKIQEAFRALVQGSYHVMHSVIPKELQGRGHLVLALAALIYSRLVNANKWNSAMVDLIFNQAHIYLVDLVRVLQKKFDDTFELKVDEMIGDVVLGIYAAKVKVEVNVVPGQGKKGKATIDSGIREYFNTHVTGILEVKKTFYAIWKEFDKYYFFDPFACDHEGFRVDPTDPESAERYKAAVACVTMNSSINQMIETILENTGNKEKDPFIIHGLRVLYIKTGTVINGPLDRVIYREKNTNRRPKALTKDLPILSIEDSCKKELDMTPKLRSNAVRVKDVGTQFPELMKNIEDYMKKEGEPMTFVELQTFDNPNPDLQDTSQKTDNTETTESDKKLSDAQREAKLESFKDLPRTGDDALRFDEREKKLMELEQQVKYVKGYHIINPHCIILQGSRNCLDPQYPKKCRGKQGLIIALTGVAYAKIKEPWKWRNLDIDQIIDVANKTYAEIAIWIYQGSRKATMENDNDGGAREERQGSEANTKRKGLGEETENRDNVTNVAGFDGVPVPNHLNLTMLPEKLQFGENEISFKSKVNIAEGDANPLANLGEALECLFKRYEELIVENSSLIYATWRKDGKFFLLNPYGSDRDGWRIRDHAASLIVTDSINELSDLFHGILEFNDSKFNIHFISVESIQPNDKYIIPSSVEMPPAEFLETYRTKFLPITDEDLIDYKMEKVNVQINQEAANEGRVDHIDNNKEEDSKIEGTGQGDAMIQNESNKQFESEMDILLNVEEHPQPDAPDRLNLFLLTDGLDIEEENQEISEESKEIIAYERLKYMHPPPYVLPSKMALSVLVEAKRASASAHSLLSRFSIDSKLAIKEGSELPEKKIPEQSAVVVSDALDTEIPSKLIKFPLKKYLVSRILSLGFTPLRAIDERFIHDEDLDKIMEEECIAKSHKSTNENIYTEKVPEIPTEIRITPLIIPLGPTIRTLRPKRKIKACIVGSDRKCKLKKKYKEDSILEKLECKTEEVLFDLLFPHSEEAEKDMKLEKKKDPCKDKKRKVSNVRMKDEKSKVKKSTEPEICGFKDTDDDIGIIEGNTCLKNRGEVDQCHFKACYYSAILCILAKVQLDVNNFRGSILDQFILVGDKIYQRTGKLRYKPLRWFHNIEILGARYNVILKQVLYADPENCEADNLLARVDAYLKKDQTGILVFSNASYAFWLNEERLYLFDPYACDDKGRANENGLACLMEFCDVSSMIKRIQENTGETSDKPYRVYSLAIAHMEEIKLKRKKKRRPTKKSCDEKISDEDESSETSENHEPVEELSLIELPEWIDKRIDKAYDMTIAGYAPIPNYNAATMEVIVLENDITRPILAPFKKVKVKSDDGKINWDEIPRKKIYDRHFKDNTAVAIPIDLCIMAWAIIHEPTHWGIRTIRGLYEASKDLALDSLLVGEDTTVADMVDGVLLEFTIANYTFRTVFAPMHHGVLYATEGWNLAMSLKKIFETPVYTGAIICCGKAHIGVMNRNGRYYAWWTITGTKTLKIVTSEDIEDFLKLIVKEINEPDQLEFLMRLVTISYARKVYPDCGDTEGLHEKAMPTTSLPEIHKKNMTSYDIETIFRPSIPNPKPIFVQGTVALRNRDTVVEPRVKRCYFVAILAVMVKRDIIQSPMPGMVDRIIEVAEGIYKEFVEPKYHTEHILRNVTVMNRIFEFRDSASTLVNFKKNSTTSGIDFFSTVRKHLQKHFKKHTDGILHFTNCCYGFWYSRSTNCYYYIDPYQCNGKGKKVSSDGTSCLCIFSSLSQMVKHMCQNRCEHTTGFFLHRLHVESINVPAFTKFQEDPMWVYLDFHWSFSHGLDIVKHGRKGNRKMLQKEKPSWNHYVIEVPNLIYSVWGTLGCYDSRFGNRAGKNQAAICVAVLAMQYLSHPSQWGPAILDSAVICGDCYYTESSKSALQKGSRHANRFNLKPCFKVFPHVWMIDFKPNMCGILYGGQGRMCLADTLNLAFQEAPNLIIECNRVALCVLATEDGYFATDPRWTGPPLFSKNYGAIYTLRCRNINVLVYCLTKMLNTNQRLEFSISPILLTFSQEICKFTGEKGFSPQKKILNDPVRVRPGKSNDPGNLISDYLTVPDEDIYLHYRRNLTTGIDHGSELENPPIPCPEPKLEIDNLNNTLISTTWHLNVGQPIPHKHTKMLYNPSLMKSDLRKCAGLPNATVDSHTKKNYAHLTEVNKYPEWIDFMKNVTESSEIPARILKDIMKSEKNESLILKKPIHCVKAPSFILDRSRALFNKQIEEMTDKEYMTYRHRISPINERPEESDNLEGGTQPIGPKIENLETENETETELDTADTKEGNLDDNGGTTDEGVTDNE